MTSESSARGVDQTKAANAANDIVSPSGPGLAPEGANRVGLTIRGGNFVDVQGRQFVANRICVNYYCG
ncbi:hypothetical protein [Streptomyces sp. NBC_01477]|uniref:hypothetical protein n=1 Tax=Streptomyces sp. NBC_01477 TaxID=2976015 RepID=UPI002E343B3F|nr:hypothetical protein [Streptomyces sp. NBC_01477]